MRNFWNAVIYFLGGAVIALVFLGILGYGAYEQGKIQASRNLNENYALTTFVIETDAKNDLVILEDGNGNLWQFRGVEDWEVGDCASLTMNDNGTPEIYDDVIVNARYSNFTAN